MSGVIVALPDQERENDRMTDQRRVVVLGSTGLIGTQAIAVAQAARIGFGSRPSAQVVATLALLADQAVALRVAAVGVGRDDAGRSCSAAGGDVADRPRRPQRSSWGARPRVALAAYDARMLS